MDIARKRPLQIERRHRNGAAVVWHKSRCRSVPDDPTECCRQPHTTADIGAHRQRQHARREGHCRAAGRATAGQFRIEGVARRTVDEIYRIGTRCEFRRVGLAHDNRAIGPHGLDQPFVFIGHIVFVYQRAVCRAQTSDFVRVLHTDR